MDKINTVDNIYFILSGIFAVFVYILILFILMCLFQANSLIELSINNPSKISSIEIDLVSNIVEKSHNITEEYNILKKDSKDNNSAEKVGSKSPISGFGAGDLFRKVDTIKPNQKNNDNLSDNRDKIALNKKSQENLATNKNDKLNKILQSTQNLAQTLHGFNQNISIENMNTSKFCNTYKDYCSKISELLYSNWDIKSSFVEVLTSIVIIKISKNGDFSYTIKKLSNNTIFDMELKKSLEKLKNIKFPTLDGIKLDNLEVVFRNKKESE